MERHRRHQKRIVLQKIGNLVEHEDNNINPVEIDKIQVDDSDSFHLCVINADYAIKWETFEGEPCGGYENWFFFGSFDRAAGVFEEIRRQVGALDNYDDNIPDETKV